MERSCNEGCFYYKERIIASVKNEFFPGINKLPNVYNNEGKVEEVFNNIIYFNDNIELDEDIDYFERITPGAFIPCKNLVSLEMIKREILHYIKTIKKTIFNLIIAGNAFEKIMIYLNSNNDFKKYINKVCIFSTNLDKWLAYDVILKSAPLYFIRVFSIEVIYLCSQPFNIILDKIKISSYVNSMLK